MAKKLQVVTKAVRQARTRLDLQRKSLINLPPTEQPLVERAIIARQQKLRQKAIRDSRNRSDEFKTFREGQAAKWKYYWDDVKNEKKNRREDWLLGPLAPNRDTALEEKAYGTTSSRRLQEVEPLEEDRLKQIPYMVGDRVVVISGKSRGQIGKITNIEEKAQSATVEGLEEFDLHVPKWMKEAQRTEKDWVTEQGHIPIRALRLVYPLPDPTTGLLKDVVVKDLEFFYPDSRKNYVFIPAHYETKTDPMTSREYQKFVYPERTTQLTEYAQEKLDALPRDTEQYYGDYLSRLPKFARFIKGLNIPIPWPETEPQPRVDNDVDTLRIEVEDRTLVLPSISLPPMPSSVIDELRNKYSRLRVRHDDDYVLQKGKEAAYKEWKQSRRLVTPEQLKLDREYKAREERMAKRELKEMEMKELEVMIAEAKKVGTTLNMARKEKVRKVA